ncbi:hypothetical protein UK23_31120 [Lentzea aerocolonigenes]|uniref:RING-type domain-containing protein n=1 Tax=Lentzea aerocolonigenes TaxID=68170 RepID=A0A0F0GN55_LENAE|nr:RING finger protein [Lentzea aerocolonigenes]KJK44001.1 hypothetical protein UK23_31120 [Lentzea aerocolonigenes]
MLSLCTICQENIRSGEETVLRPCGHEFCTGCLSEHVHRLDPVIALTCPNCRGVPAGAVVREVTVPLAHTDFLGDREDPVALTLMTDARIYNCAVIPELDAPADWAQAAKNLLDTVHARAVAVSREAELLISALGLLRESATDFDGARTWWSSLGMQLRRRRDIAVLTDALSPTARALHDEYLERFVKIGAQLSTLPADISDPGLAADLGKLAEHGEVLTATWSRITAAGPDTRNLSDLADTMTGRFGRASVLLPGITDVVNRTIGFYQDAVRDHETFLGQFAAE